MANYDTLPIFKDTYDLMLRIMHAVSHFPREYKYTLGERIQNQALELLVHIYMVNSTKYKAELLRQMEQKIQLFYLLLRISRDMKLLPLDTYVSIVEMVDGIASQTKGWLKANEKVRESVTSTD